MVEKVLSHPAGGKPVKRCIVIAAGLCLAAGSILFLHGAITGDGVAASAFDWELRRGATIWPQDIYEALLVILVVIPAAVLIGIAVLSRRSEAATPASVSLPPKRMALWAVLIGACSILLAGLSYGRTLLLPPFDAPAIEIALDQIPAASSIAEGQAIVLGVAHLDLAVDYEEGSGSGKTGVSRQGHRLTPITPAHWLPSEPVRIVSEAPILTVHDQVSGRYRPDREGDLALPTKAAGILLGGQIPGFIRMAFAREGVTLSPDVRLQSTNPQAGRTRWYVCAALLALAGAFGNGVAVLVYAASSKARRR